MELLFFQPNENVSPGPRFSIGVEAISMGQRVTIFCLSINSPETVLGLARGCADRVQRVYR
jgi:hypothetical protein